MAVVLIIDDEASVRFALRQVLEASGHQVVEAVDGEDGLHAASGVDVVITDLVMPKKDGIAVLDQLVAEAPERPVIMLTARGSERVAVQAIRAGAFDYLVKPFDIEAVEIAVERATETHRLRRWARDQQAEAVLGRPVIGSSPAFRRLLDKVARLARRPVLYWCEAKRAPAKSSSPSSCTRTDLVRRKPGSPSTVRPSRPPSRKRSYSAPRKAPLPAPTAIVPVTLPAPTGALWSSTRSESSPLRCSRSCCAPCSPVRFSR